MYALLIVLHVLQIFNLIRLLNNKQCTQNNLKLIKLPPPPQLLLILVFMKKIKKN